MTERSERGTVCRRTNCAWHCSRRETICRGRPDTSTPADVHDWGHMPVISCNFPALASDRWLKGYWHGLCMPPERTIRYQAHCGMWLQCLLETCSVDRHLGYLFPSRHASPRFVEHCLEVKQGANRSPAVENQTQSLKRKQL